MRVWSNPCLVALMAVSTLPLHAANPPATIRQIAVHHGPAGLQIEIAVSAKVEAQTQVLTGPDRIVIDFPDTVPAKALRDIVVNQSELSRIRIAQFTANPPVARVVLDLQSPRPYDISSLRNSVMVRLGGAAASVTSAPITSAPVLPVSVTPQRMQVSLYRGLLRVHSDKATLAEILNEIQRKTGAEVDFPPDASQDQVVTDLGPAPVRDVVAALLDGSRFNFVMMGSVRDPQGLQSLLLTPRTGGISQPTGIAPPTRYVPVPEQGSDNAQPNPPQPNQEEPAPVELPEQEQATPQAPATQQ